MSSVFLCCFTTMATAKAFISLPLAFLFVLLLSFNSGGTLKLVNANNEKTWCVAKPSSDDAALQENIHYACGNVDCQIIRSGCPCFLPNNLISHASIVMNLYYQAKGRNEWNCHFTNSGLIVTTDPSYGDCEYA